MAEFFLLIFIKNYFVCDMNDVNFKIEFPNSSLFNFYLIALGVVLNYTHFGDSYEHIVKLRTVYSWKIVRPMTSFRTPTLFSFLNDFFYIMRMYVCTRRKCTILPNFYGKKLSAILNPLFHTNYQIKNRINSNLNLNLGYSLNINESRFTCTAIVWKTFEMGVVLWPTIIRPNISTFFLDLLSKSLIVLEKPLLLRRIYV